MGNEQLYCPVSGTNSKDGYCEDSMIMQDKPLRRLEQLTKKGDTISSGRASLDSLANDMSVSVTMVKSIGNL